MDEYISREAVINITAETGAWETQNRVRELPAADVQPVKHGKWVPHKITASSKCSECNRVFSDETNYCPSCGAKLDL